MLPGLGDAPGGQVCVPGASGVASLEELSPYHLPGHQLDTARWMAKGLGAWHSALVQFLITDGQCCIGNLMVLTGFNFYILTP